LGGINLHPEATQLRPMPVAVWKPRGGRRCSGDRRADTGSAPTATDDGRMD